MPFSRPTLTELRAGVAADIATELPGADGLLRYSNLGILAQGQAALAHGHYGYLDWIAKQAVPFTATDEYLEGWAALKGVTRKPATAASGPVTLSGTNGVELPDGSPVTRSDGRTYVTTASAAVSSGSVTVQVVATEPGAGGNADAGTVFALAIGIAGIAASGAASGPLTGGADVELDDDLLSRMLEAYAAPPQGGTATDYIRWAKEVPGVTRCWVKPSGMGPGTIILYFMMDDAESVHGGFPQGSNGVAAGDTRAEPAAGDQLALANAIFPQQPVTALVYAVAPTANTLTLTIAGLSGAASSVRTAISAAIGAALLRSAIPGGVTPVLSIEAAIAGVAGSSGAVITNIACTAGSVSPGSAGNITSDAGALPVLGSITWS